MQNALHEFRPKTIVAEELNGIYFPTKSELCYL